MRRSADTNGPSLWEFLGLISVLIFTSMLVVQANWNTIWMDWEFTGWVAPIANRLTSGVKLYQDQTHSPMPPLPYLLTYAISRGDASWLTESRLIVGAQAVLVLAMYLALSRNVARPIPFVASLGSIPIYFALPKRIFYDALVQVCVALAALIAVPLVISKSNSDSEGDTGLSRGYRLAGCAVLAAIALLSKQSTGAGMVVGIGVMLSLFGKPRLRRRFTDVALFACFTIAALAVITLLVSPWVDVKGLAHDVFLTGSEPKGGVRMIALNAVAYAKAIAGTLGLVVAYGVVFTTALGIPRARESESPSATGGAFDGVVAPSIVAALAAPPAMIALARYAPVSLAEYVAPALDAVRPVVLSSGLMTCLLVTVLRFRRRPPSPGIPNGSWMPAMFAVLFLSAIFHNLSSTEFRWSYDNNPLITLALAAAFLGAMQLATRGGGTRQCCENFGRSRRRLACVVLALECVGPPSTPLRPLSRALA